MQKLRCGVSGLGRGRLFVQKLAELQGCEVVAVCDPDERVLAGFSGLACYTEYEQFMAEADLDVVAVISPGPAHAAQSLLALESGAHVLSETPCVYSLDEAATLTAAVRRTGRKYMLAEDYIFMGWVQRWKELVEAGELGEVIAAQGEYTHDCRGIFLLDEQGRYVPWADRNAHPEAQPSWRATHLPPLNYCSHTLGPLLYLMQDRCVTASGLHAGSRTFAAAATIDLASAVLHTERGAVISLTNGFGVAHPFAFLIGLYGTKGSIRCVNFGSPQVKVFRDTSGEWSERADGRDWLTVMLEGFIASIREDTKPPIDVFEAMDYTVPGICAHLSADQGGRPVAIPNYRQQDR